MVDKLLYQEAWEQGKDEKIEDFGARKDLQREQLYQSERIHGHCYMIKFGDDDLRPIWESQLDMADLSRRILSPIGMPLDCPLCQPYDHWDKLQNRYTDRRFMTKIIDPKYPEGVVDRGGVWAKCPCLLKGDARKNLKFKGMGRVNGENTV